VVVSLEDLLTGSLPEEVPGGQARQWEWEGGGEWEWGAGEEWKRG